MLACQTLSKIVPSALFKFTQLYREYLAEDSGGCVCKDSSMHKYRLGWMPPGEAEMVLD